MLNIGVMCTIPIILESSALETYQALVSWKRSLQMALIPQLVLPLLFNEQGTVIYC